MRRRRIGGLGALAFGVLLGWALLSAWILSLHVPAAARLGPFDPDHVAAPVEPDLSILIHSLEAHRDVPDASSWAFFATDLNLAKGIVEVSEVEIVEKDTPDPVRVTAGRGMAPLEQDSALAKWTLGEIVLSGSPVARLPRDITVETDQLLFDPGRQRVRSDGLTQLRLGKTGEFFPTEGFVYDLRKPELTIPMEAAEAMSQARKLEKEPGL